MDVPRTMRRSVMFILHRSSLIGQHRGRLPLAICALAIPLTVPGCIDRRLTITSDPPGAIVTLNEVEVGRTPLQTRFLWYGTYDVRLNLDGFEPLSTSRAAAAPIYEIPPLDLPASALPITTNIHWHFELIPTPPDTPEMEADLIRRARELREQL